MGRADPSGRISWEVVAAGPLKLRRSTRVFHHRTMLVEFQFGVDAWMAARVRGPRSPESGIQQDFTALH